MTKKYSFEYVKQYCLTYRIEFLKSEYINGKTRTAFKCLNCEDIWETDFATIHNKKSKCPKCAGVKRYTLEEIKNICLKHNIDFLDDYYNNTKEMHRLKCLKMNCDHEWITGVCGITSAKHKKFADYFYGFSYHQRITRGTNVFKNPARSHNGTIFL